MTNYVITIARGLGSGGSHIARQLSEKLDIPYYDAEILKMASEESGINEKYFFEANEKINSRVLLLEKPQITYCGHSLMFLV